MFYLVIQTSLILLITAAVFFVLGTVYSRFQQRRKEVDALADLPENEHTGPPADALPAKEAGDPSETETSDPLEDKDDQLQEFQASEPAPPEEEAETSQFVVQAAEIEQLRSALRHLQDQLVDRERVIEELSRAMPPPTPAEDGGLTAEPAAEPVSDPAKDAERDSSTGEIRLMSKIPQLEAAIETQGALLESKSLALEKTKLQLDRERERASLLEQKLMLVESELSELRTSQIQSLWNGAEAPPASAEKSDPAAKETEIAMLRAERETMQQELSELQAANEALREQHSSQQADDDALTLWREKAETFEKEAEERRRIEQSLRDEIKALRHQIERQHADANTKVVEANLMERVARAEAEATQRRDEMEDRYLGRIAELERSLDGFTAEKEALAKAQGQLQTLERAFDTLQREKEELARTADQVPGMVTAIEELRAEKSALERFAQRAEELEVGLEVARSAKEELEQSLASARRQIEELERDSARIVELERTVDKMRWEAQTHAEQVARVPELERELQQKRETEARVPELERELQERREAAERAEARTRDLESALERHGALDAEAERLRLRIQELEAALQRRQQDNDIAWIEARLESDEKANPPVAKDDGFRRELELLRQEWQRVESERRARDEARLETIQRKLEQIESELIAMENLLKREADENEIVSAVWRVEHMLKDRERAPAGSGGRERELQYQISRLETALVEKERLIERLSREEAREGDGEVKAMQVLVAEREQLIATLKKQLSQLSHPELAGDDNLQLIHGVGPYTKKVLKEEFGITTFRQVARLTAEDIQRISERLFFKGRIQREDWLGQAIALHFKKYNEIVENPEPPYPMKWAG